MHSLLRILGVGLLLGTYSYTLAQDTLTTEQQIDQLVNLLEKGRNIDQMTVNIRDVNFELDSDKVTDETLPLLDKVVYFLKKVPNIGLEINGHTDNQGAKAYNQRLSERRADAVRDYLLTQLQADASITDTALQSANRIIAQGFGETQPLIDNATKEGRAKNRRVEFVIIKQEVKTIQDLILLCKGDTLGVVIDTIIETEAVYYYDFSSDQRKKVSIAEVCAVVFADGTRREFPKESIEEEPEQKLEPKETVSLWDRLTFLHCPDAFGKGAGIVLFGPELLHNLTDDPLPNREQGSFPLGLTYEQGVTCNVGIGLTFAARTWGQPEDPDASYLYYAVSARAVYHLNIHPKIDPYVGITGTYRQVRLTQLIRDETYQANEYAVSVNGLIGVRYYVTQRLGLFAEAGSDAIAKFRLGAFAVLRQPE